MGDLLERERADVREAAGWVGAGEGEEKGSSGGCRSWGSSRGPGVWGDQAVVKCSSRRCQGKVSPVEPGWAREPALRVVF